jgi:hypothetical protein
MEKLIIFVTLLVTIFACKSDPPTPNLAVEMAGTYIAVQHEDGTKYPINGQNVTIQVTRQPDNSLNVVVSSTPNGVYSPGVTRTYRNAVVENPSEGGSSNRLWFVDISARRLTNSLTFYNGFKEADYVFIPDGWTKGDVSIRFRKQ